MRRRPRRPRCGGRYQAQRRKALAHAAGERAGVGLVHDHELGAGPEKIIAVAEALDVVGGDDHERVPLEERLAGPQAPFEPLDRGGENELGRDVKLLVEVETTLRLAAYQPGRIEFVPTEAAPRDLAQRLGSRLQGWTGNRWAVSVVNDGGGQTIAELRDAHEESLRQTAQEHPLVQAVMKEFPNASITSIRTPDAIAAEAETAALPPVEDEWDPFEEE